MPKGSHKWQELRVNSKADNQKEGAATDKPVSPHVCNFVAVTLSTYCTLIMWCWRYASRTAERFKVMANKIVWSHNNSLFHAENQLKQPATIK